MWRPTLQQAARWSRDWGTPFYVYDIARALGQVTRLREATRGRVTLWYALKANANRELLRALEPGLDGVDVASSGELGQAIAAGFASRRIGFTGPAKGPADLAAAVRAGVRVSVESLDEIECLARVAANAGCAASASIRINPRQRRHAFRVATGGVPGPFGVDEAMLETAVRTSLNHAPHVVCDGIHVHAGSGCSSAKAWHGHAIAVFEIAARAAELGLPLKVVNLGGGFATGARALDVEELGRRLTPTVDDFRARIAPVEVVLEPGRFVMADAGAYVCRVIRRVRSQGEEIVILDGGINSFLFAAQRDHGDRTLEVHNLTRGDGAPSASVRLVGPTCTPLDTLGQFEVPDPRPGDLLAIGPAGAYGFSASPLLFLGHDTPAELLHSDGEVRCVRPRRRLADYA